VLWNFDDPKGAYNLDVSDHLSEMPPRRTLRNFDAGRHVESFLTAAVAAVLLIRFVLRITDFPQLGGGHLHVGHVLWGGIMMTASMLILLSYLDRGSVELAAILGGIGFGTFIDEVGKFVTKDNDYFFRPSIAVIYVAFILVFLAARAIRSRGAYARAEYQANAFRILTEASLRGLDTERRAQALHDFERAGDDALANEVKALLHTRAAVRTARQRRLSRLRRQLINAYRRLTQLPGFTTTVIAFFVIQLVGKAVLVAVLIFVRGLGEVSLADMRYIGSLASRVAKLNFAGWAEIGSSLLSGVLMLGGIAEIRRSRLTAYRYFERATLVSIFLTQVFMFYREQLSGLIGLAFNLAVLIALRFMIHREEARLAAEHLAATSAPGQRRRGLARWVLGA
jgi:hypothetical protein